MTRRFVDRTDAGRRLAGLLRGYAGRADVVVLGLARGGVPVAAPIARALGAPLDVFVVRKIGLPGRPELAVGAIATGGVVVWNDDVIATYHLTEDQLRSTIDAEQAELVRREALYRGNRPGVPVIGRTVLLVDDGLATGASMRAAARAIRRARPGRLVVAVPTAPVGTELGPDVDELVCAVTPAPFRAVASSYRTFPQTSDDEVRALLAR